MLSKFSNLAFLNQTIINNSTRLLASETKNFQPTPGNVKKSPVWAWTEWDPLEEIVVGDPTFAVTPQLWPETKACIAENKYDFLVKHMHKYWKDVIDPDHYKKMLWEHANFVKTLEGEGVTVVHPDPYDFQVEHRTPYFSARGVDCAMPRDFLLVVGDELIESTMTWRSRYFEFLCYKRLIKDYWKRGAKWTAAPKPVCNEALYKQNYFLSELSENFLESKDLCITNEEPVFDAADFIRCGRDIFGHVSHVTNTSGIAWLRRHLAPRGIRVHGLNFIDPKAMHIDTTLFTLRPGLAISCPERQCKQIGWFKKAGWDVVLSPYTSIPKTFPYYISSQWLSINIVMLDQNRVLVEKDDVNTFKFFEKIGITPVKIPFKHMFSIGGGIHCWTSDTRRRGDLETYFDWPQELLEQFDKTLEDSYDLRADM